MYYCATASAEGKTILIRIGDGPSQFRMIFTMGTSMEDFGSKCYVQVKCSQITARHAEMEIL